ncbi:hypothetical protein M758_1G267600 [Ceratodon purpureus]|uniref:Uncharacterized protein n=1 Tax=Ceratodon purpureus TaxID=3225 RepID=A0A8T0J9X8_CERPU|nr:hypothetical protein KC19_1G275500 [Ceratodon purpureus]KAG0631623.1 hypothetical protein M758_1G267600 [Ceratodon purpureus]
MIQASLSHCSIQHSVSRLGRKSSTLLLPQLRLHIPIVLLRDGLALLNPGRILPFRNTADSFTGRKIGQKLKREQHQHIHCGSIQLPELAPMSSTETRWLCQRQSCVTYAPSSDTKVLFGSLVQNWMGWTSSTLPMPKMQKHKHFQSSRDGFSNGTRNGLCVRYLKLNVGAPSCRNRCRGNYCEIMHYNLVAQPLISGSSGILKPVAN